MKNTYDILRHNKDIDGNQFGKKVENNDNANGQSNDEIASTDSFLSDLSDVSRTDDDRGVQAKIYENRSFEIGNWIDKTFASCTNKADGDSELLNKTIRPEQFLHVSKDFIQGKLSDERDNRFVEEMSITEEFDPDPIYEQINDDHSLSDDGNKENDAPLIKVDSKSDAQKNCEHNFSLRTVSRSDTCFLCWKK